MFSELMTVFQCNLMSDTWRNFQDKLSALLCSASHTAFTLLQINGMGSTKQLVQPQPPATPRGHSAKVTNSSDGTRGAPRLDVKHIDTKTISEKGKLQPSYVSMTLL